MSRSRLTCSRRPISSRWASASLSHRAATFILTDFHRITFKPHLPRYQLLVHRSLHAGDAGIVIAGEVGRIDFFSALWFQGVSAKMAWIEPVSIPHSASASCGQASAFRRNDIMLRSYDVVDPPSNAHFAGPERKNLLSRRPSPLEQALVQHQLRDLHRIKRRPFAEVVADDPEREAVFDGVIFADA